MSGYLLDTNVVTDHTSQRPHLAVAEFLATHDDLWLSVIVLQELELGVQLLPEGRRRVELRQWLSGIVRDFGARVLPVEQREAEWAAAFRAHAHRDGRVLTLADALIAGTAKARELSLVTRNVRDFAALDIPIVNPWDAA